MKYLIVVVFIIVLYNSLYAQKSTNAYSRVEIIQTCTRVDSLNDTTAAFYRHNIEGYSNQTSYQQDDTLKLYIGTKLQSLNNSAANLQIIRYDSAGWSNSSVFSNTIILKCYSGFNTDAYKQGANWDLTTSIQIENWKSGFYCAKITSGGDTGVVPFVIRQTVINAGSTSKILWVVPFNTYQAYNSWGGSSLYWTGHPSAIYQTDIVSFNRPFGEQWDKPNFQGYKYEDALGQFNLREWAWVQWIENGRYAVEYCTDYDIHQDNNGDLLKKYKTVIIPSHSEYWTEDMRNNITNFIAGNFPNQNAPGNVAFFGANICYWMVDYADNGRKMIVRKCGDKDLWRNQTDQQSGKKMHEALFIGSEFRPIEQRHAVPQVVTNPSHWIYKNSHLSSAGHVFGSGNANWEPLASGEIDDTLQGFSPSNVQVLARTDANYDSIAHNYSSVSYYINQQRNSRVFNGASFGWHGSLFACGDTVATMVKNILDHFSGVTYADSIVFNETWSNDLRIFAHTYLRSGKILSTSGTRTFIVDSAVTLSVNGTLEINGTTTITGQNNKWGELAIRSGGTLRVKSGATLNLNSPLYFVIESGANIIVENGGTLNIRTNTSTGSNDTIKVLSGGTLNFYPPGEIYFGTGSGILSYGKFNVTGTSSQSVIFSSISNNPSAGSWGCIALNGSGVNGSNINYASFLYGTEIQIINVQSAVVQNSIVEHMSGIGINCYHSNCWIMSTTISDVGTHGIVAQSGATVACYHNNISDTSLTGAGILYSGGSWDYVWDNTIQGFEWGVGTIWGSSPLFGHPSNNEDNNTIKYCKYGLVSYQRSYPIVNQDYYDEDMNEYYVDDQYTGNNIYGNTTKSAWIDDTSTVYAQHVYWGGGNPDYYLGDSSQLIYQPVSTTLWAGTGSMSVKLFPPLTENQAKNAKINSRNLKLNSQIPSVKNKKSKNLLWYLKELERNPENISAYQDLYRMYNDTTADSIITFLELNAKKSSGMPNILLSNLYYKKGDLAKTKDFNMSIAVSGNDQKKIESAKLRNYYITLYDENNKAEAEKLFNEINEKGVNSIEYSLAKDALKNYMFTSSPVGKSGSNKFEKNISTTLSVQPKEFRLDQNYPNPFNPTTTISFSVPEANHVALVVYDYIGREVSVLVDGFISEGAHEVVFDASKISSGIYFYKLSSGRNISTKKMLLLK